MLFHCSIKRIKSRLLEDLLRRGTRFVTTSFGAMQLQLRDKQKYRQRGYIFAIREGYYKEILAILSNCRKILHLFYRIGVRNIVKMGKMVIVSMQQMNYNLLLQLQLLLYFYLLIYCYCLLLQSCNLLLQYCLIMKI